MGCRSLLVSFLTLLTAVSACGSNGKSGGLSGGQRTSRRTYSSTCSDWLSADTPSKKRLIDNLDFSVPIVDTSYGVVIPHMDTYCPSHQQTKLSDALYASSLRGPTP